MIQNTFEIPKRQFFCSRCQKHYWRNWPNLEPNEKNYCNFCGIDMTICSKEQEKSDLK